MAASWMQWIARLSQPELARAMEREGNALGQPGAAAADHIAIEDHGADTTLVCFAGMAVLYAGLPQFEFQRLLHSEGQQYNYVFVRDCRRMLYLETPEGKSGGLDFYAAEVRRALDMLGARRNITIGASGGGAMAIYFAARLGLDHAVAFSPGFPENTEVPYSSWGNFMKHLAKARVLMHDPAGWFEPIMMMSAGSLLSVKIERRLGKNCWTDLVERFAQASPQPSVTVVIGTHSTPDDAQARLLQRKGAVEVMRIGTPRHNVAGVLKKQGRLKEVLDAALVPVSTGTRADDAVQEPLATGHNEQEGAP